MSGLSFIDNNPNYAANAVLQLQTPETYASVQIGYLMDVMFDLYNRTATGPMSYDDEPYPVEPPPPAPPPPPPFGDPPPPGNGRFPPPPTPPSGGGGNKKTFCEESDEDKFYVGEAFVVLAWMQGKYAALLQGTE